MEHGFVMDERTVRHFTNEVRVMTVLPYLCESVATITVEVFGSSVHLPIIPRGEIAIDLAHHGMGERAQSSLEPLPTKRRWPGGGFQ